MKMNIVAKLTAKDDKYACAIADKIIEEGERVIFIKNASVTNEVVRFVLSFGSDVKVVQPIELKEEIRNIILSMYNEISL